MLSSSLVSWQGFFLEAKSIIAGSKMKVCSTCGKSFPFIQVFTTVLAALTHISIFEREKISFTCIGLCVGILPDCNPARLPLGEKWENVLQSENKDG